MNLQDKIKGMFLGLAIGDALGKPVEMLTASEIREKVGKVKEYISSKRTDGVAGELGSWTDDTQLSLAVARGIITGGCIDLDAIASEHVEEYQKSVAGWGGSTRDAVRKLANGDPWNQSGQTSKENRGFGNGVAMKIAPVGAYMAATNPNANEPQWSQDVESIANLSIMTHYTNMGIVSGLSHAFAVNYCLTTKKFQPKEFVDILIGACDIGCNWFKKAGMKDDIRKRYESLMNYNDEDKIIEDFNGSCYIYDSLPFTYAFFLRNYENIDSLYDVVSGGGDTDTNGSMLGSLLGALYGQSFFPKNLVDGLHDLTTVQNVADQFCKKFCLV